MGEAATAMPTEFACSDCDVAGERKKFAGGDESSGQREKD